MTVRWELANCQGVDTATMFPPAGREGRETTRQAKAICHRCIIRDACLEHALEHGERHGVWGGHTEWERIRIRRSRRRSA